MNSGFVLVRITEEKKQNRNEKRGRKRKKKVYTSVDILSLE